MFRVYLGNTLIAKFWSYNQAKEYFETISPADLAVWDYRIVREAV